MFVSQLTGVRESMFEYLHESGDTRDEKHVPVVATGYGSQKTDRVIQVVLDHSRKTA